MPRRPSSSHSRRNKLAPLQPLTQFHEPHQETLPAEFAKIEAPTLQKLRLAARSTDKLCIYMAYLCTSPNERVLYALPGDCRTLHFNLDLIS